MLLMVEALLLISAALLQDHRAAVLSHPLDMAENSVDDRYDGCAEQMTKLLKTGYSEEDFKKAWEEDEKGASEAKEGLRSTHLKAIYVYTDKVSEVYTKFNGATRTEKQKYIDGSYSWYSLHFLLTEAIQILNKQMRIEKKDKCIDTYRGTPSKFEYESGEVRMSSFSSSSRNKKEAEKFKSVSCFEIHTCEGADVAKYSKYPKEEEVLIPPYEKFKVTAVLKRKDQKDLWCETVYKLESSGIKSDLNCEFARIHEAKL